MVTHPGQSIKYFAQRRASCLTLPPPPSHHSHPASHLEKIPPRPSQQEHSRRKKTKNKPCEAKSSKGFKPISLHRVERVECSPIPYTFSDGVSKYISNTTTTLKVGPPDVHAFRAFCRCSSAAAARGYTPSQHKSTTEHLRSTPIILNTTH